MSDLSETRDEIARHQATIRTGQQTIRDALTQGAGALEAHRHHVARQREALINAARAVCASRPDGYARWTDAAVWDTWVCQPALPAELRVGELVDPEGVPATLPVFGDQAIVITTRTESAAAHARQLIRSLAMRAAVALGDKVVLHLLDPHQEGFGFPERSYLSQDAPRTHDVARDLKAVIDAAYAFQQRHDGRRFSQLSPEARASQQVHLVLALDYPQGYGYQAVEHLNRIANLGPSGVQLIVHDHVGVASPTGATLDLRYPIVLDVDAQGFGREPWGSLVARLDAAPPTELVSALSARMPMPEPEAETDIPDNLPWADVNSTDPATWWRGDATHEIETVIGRTVAGEPLALMLGQQPGGPPRPHVVVGGTTGSGKGVLLQTFILGLATRYSPDEVRFYLVDGQRGTTVQAFATLPHADLVTMNTPIDLARGVLTDIRAELTRRDGMLVAAGVDSSALYRKRTGRTDMPRLVVVIDEYQALFEGDRRDETAGILTTIAAQGRKVGLHLVLASQRFHATGLLNQSALFDNIETRISLKLTEDAIDALDEFDREGRELIRSHATDSGRVVVNQRGGAAGASVAGQVAMSESVLPRIVAQLAARAEAKGDRRRPVVVNGNAQPTPADSVTLAALSRVDPADHAALKAWAESDARAGGLAVTNWQPYDHPFVFVAGRTFTVHGAAAAKVDRASEHNVMLVAGDAEVLSGMAFAGLASAGLSVAPGRLTVAVAGELPPPGSWAGALTTGLPRLLARRGHQVSVARTAADAVVLLDAALAELDRRAQLDPNALAELGPYLFVALGADRLPALRLVEGRYGVEPSEAGAKLLRLLKEGPFVGVHGVLGFTSRATWAQVMPDKGRRFFVHRFLQQVSEDDSRVLLDTGFGFKISPPGVPGPQRAGYHQRDAGTETVFLPYTTADDPIMAFESFYEGAR